jgi:hypothetical protein
MAWIPNGFPESFKKPGALKPCKIPENVGVRNFWHPCQVKTEVPKMQKHTTLTYDYFYWKGRPILRV